MDKEDLDPVKILVGVLFILVGCMGVLVGNLAWELTGKTFFAFAPYVMAVLIWICGIITLCIGLGLKIKGINKFE